MRIRPTEPRICVGCGHQFDALLDNIKKGWGRFCSKPCYHQWRSRQPSKAHTLNIRRLSEGEAIPAGTPRCYLTNDGYVLLRWKIGPRQYVEALEHRVIVGLDAEQVHHINGDKTDNRPENLEPVSASAHTQKHVQPQFDVDEAAQLYREGWSLPRLARKYGVHAVSIMRTLKRRGVTMRPRRRYRSVDFFHPVDVAILGGDPSL